MTEILTVDGSRGFEFWALIPDYAKLREEFPVCLHDLDTFCALPQSQVKLFLLSKNGMRSAMKLMKEHDGNGTQVVLCESPAEVFERPILRRVAMDDEVDYFEPTAEGFTRLPQTECDALEKRVLSAISDMH